jgi:hypothetical protein
MYLLLSVILLIVILYLTALSDSEKDKRGYDYSESYDIYGVDGDQYIVKTYRDKVYTFIRIYGTYSPKDEWKRITYEKKDYHYYEIYTRVNLSENPIGRITITFHYDGKDNGGKTYVTYVEGYVNRYDITTYYDYNNGNELYSVVKRWI